ncbi:hypothetical protein M422DRAFT_257725 [Sphaerobolus stellatus SS14]|uniref:Uncharacterized protein n=1 Tax=Sphaerobolus stellatus (strain SS14) TaxID=990650 RepID=A0A0C9VN62_SPHS4|nr:hypothetical protein M422DRAFT_257725 [Sphaerobolus stellatus SS14]
MFIEAAPEPVTDLSVEWSERWLCDHAGKPRNNRNPNISPSKSRTRAPSIKVGCKAWIYAERSIGNDMVKIVHRWEHAGHNADSLDNMRASRNPDVVRAWLDEKVSQGFDQKAIKALLRMTSEELSEITPYLETVPYSIKINAMDIYNAIRRKGDIDTRLASELDDSIALWLEKLLAFLKVLATKTSLK